MRKLYVIFISLIALATLSAATLERLSFDNLVAKSTGIVRARVTSTSVVKRGSLIQTCYRIQVLDRWKGTAASETEVVLPGGTSSGLRQHFAGVPELTVGSEYVFFLWTGPKSGITQLTGLTQGLFYMKTDSDGNAVAYRPASGEVMLDETTGQPVKDEAIELKLTELSQRITSSLAASGSSK
jgi:hypothetical protein